MVPHDIDPRLIGLLLLAIKRKARGPNRAVNHDVQRWLRDNLYSPYSPRYLIEKLEYEVEPNRELGNALQPHLHYMEKLGLIRRVDTPEGDGRPALSGWRLALADKAGENPTPDQLHADRTPGGGDGGNDGGQGRGGANSGDGGADGGGIREVLSHPTLFALPQQEFEDFVSGLFDEQGAL